MTILAHGQSRRSTYHVVTDAVTRRALFTLDRDTATSGDDLELLGLDYTFVQEELVRRHSLPPEEIGIAVAEDVDVPALLSFWSEASVGKGEQQSGGSVYCSELGRHRSTCGVAAKQRCL